MFKLDQKKCFCCNEKPFLILLLKMTYKQNLKETFQRRRSQHKRPSDRWSDRQTDRPTDRRALLTRLSSAWMFSWQIKTLRRWNSLRGPISGLLHQLGGINTRQWSRLGASDRYLMIQSYLTSWHSLSSTHHRTPGRTSCGPLNGNKQENKGLIAINDICVQKCNRSKWEMISRGDSDQQICRRGFRLSVLLFKKTKRQRKEQKLASFALVNSVWMSDLILKTNQIQLFLVNLHASLFLIVVLFFLNEAKDT